MLSLAFSLFGLLILACLFYFIPLYCVESIRCNAMNSIHEFYEAKRKNNNKILTKDSTSQVSAPRCREDVNTDDIFLKKNHNEILTKDSTSRFSAFRCREDVNTDDISLEEKRILISRIKELENRISELENKKERC